MVRVIFMNISLVKERVVQLCKELLFMKKWMQLTKQKKQNFCGLINESTDVSGTQTLALVYFGRKIAKHLTVFRRRWGAECDTQGSLSTCL